MSPSASPAVRRQQMISKLGYLSEVDIFQDLSQPDLDWLDSLMSLTSFDRGQLVFSPEERNEVLFLLKRGRVQVYRQDGDGKRLVITTLGPGALFGEMTLMGQGMHNTYAEALEDSMVGVMTRADIERLLREKPQVALRLVSILGQRLKEAEARLEDIAFKSIPARLASLLLRLAHVETGQVTGYTHQDLAEMIGTYRETTTQTLNHFKGQGLLEIGRKRIAIRDRSALERLANW